MAPEDPAGGATGRAHHIRPATAADGDFIRELTPRFAEAGTPPGRDPARMSTFFLHSIGEIVELVTADSVSPREAVLIATDDAGIRLGFVHLRPDLSGLTGEWQGYVNALAVTPAAEGRGVAQALLAAGEAWAREQGFRHLALDTFGANGRARVLYARWGFAEETLKLVKTL
ncbi:MAG: hypothetical protein AVDCRST_MAG18-184 [uncultured Thermomicrobiales bacterium]|uniref:N-acetyltransferase domain-containing protein n=1 Tax=uncultured Thermomicrobiales bacterium TaxID=1645740 RepID=A0A6J4UJJ8_9BACT|nr:MAG: hypothetical protein AVDCRST_MAG18-184 [uncultured Thermomicrobiales bacterium]